MRNENLFEVLGRKIREMIATLREKNSHRRSLLHHLFTQENSTRSSPSMRKLQSFTKNLSSRADHNSSRSRHRLRHGKNSKRLTELFLRNKNNSMLNKMVLHLDGDSALVAVSTNESNRRTVPAINEMSRDNLEEGLDVHDHCYTTNDVLEIIALTCLVNFIFWFLIIFCVNVFTRNQKMWKFNSHQSKPLKLWDRRVRAGHISQVLDQDLHCYVLEIVSIKSSRTYITCPADPKKVLAIPAPFLHFTVKNLHRSFVIDVLIRDHKRVDRRFRAMTKQKETQLKPYTCKMPLTLENGWNEVVLPLKEYTYKAYGTIYVETLRVQMHATCRVQRIYFSYNHQEDEEFTKKNLISD